MLCEPPVLEGKRPQDVEFALGTLWLFEAWTCMYSSGPARSVGLWNDAQNWFCIKIWKPFSSTPKTLHITGAAKDRYQAQRVEKDGLLALTNPNSIHCLGRNAL